MVLVLCPLLSCVGSKAAIDYTLSEGIIWPGEPEKPRILYLWSLSRISGKGKKGKLLSILAGEETMVVGDPRESEFVVRPHGVFVDDKDIMYIADPGAYRVSVIDLKTMDSFNIEHILGNMQFSAPIGVVAGLDGRIYVTDSGLGAVLIFNNKGKYAGKFEGRMQRPTGIAINNLEGIVYVVDTWGHTVYKFDLEGNRKGSFGGRGKGDDGLNYPTHIALDDEGNIYVSDTLNFRVKVFTPTGTLVSSFGLIGDSYGSFDKIKGIAVDSEDHVYIADSAQDNVQIFNKRGDLLLFFGGKGHGYGKFYLPTGMYIDKKDRIFVSDYMNRRVQAFQFLGGN